MDFSAVSTRDKPRKLNKLRFVDQDRQRQESEEMDKLKAFIKSNEKLLAQFRSTISDIDTHLQEKTRQGSDQSTAN